jgi:hypothetical protein
VIAPINIKDMATTFMSMNALYTLDPDAFGQQFNIKYDRTNKIIKCLRQFRKFIQICGISYMYALIRDKVMAISVPTVPAGETAIRVTTDAPGVILSIPDSVNWLTALAAGTGLLPSNQYPQIKKALVSQRDKSLLLGYSDFIVQTQMPGNNASYYFGHDKNTGANPGYDIFSHDIKHGTAQGDMVETIKNSSTWFIVSVIDMIYDLTRNIVGRVITPARKKSMGAFI